MKSVFTADVKTFKTSRGLLPSPIICNLSGYNNEAVFKILIYFSPKDTDERCVTVWTYDRCE